PAKIRGKQLAALTRQIEEDGATLEHGKRPALVLRLKIDDGRKLVIGIDRLEMRLEMLTGEYVVGDELVGDLRFLKHDRDFQSVRRAYVVKIDHRGPRNRGSDS